MPLCVTNPYGGVQSGNHDGQRRPTDDQLLHTYQRDIRHHCYDQRHELRRGQRGEVQRNNASFTVVNATQITATVLPSPPQD